MLCSFIHLTVGTCQSTRRHAPHYLFQYRSMNLTSHKIFYWNTEVNSTGKTKSNKPDIALKIWHERQLTKNCIAPNAEINARSCTSTLPYTFITCRLFQHRQTLSFREQKYIRQWRTTGMYTRICTHIHTPKSNSSNLQ